MPERPLRAAVIGLGVGEQHVLGYRRIPGVEVVAVCDRDEDRLTEVADRLDVAERYLDAAKITEHPDVDVVSICSWDDSHAALAISAFRHGKHVMVEKPVALSRAEAAKVVAAQQESGLCITSNLILRASPRFRDLKERIDRGDLGDLFYVEGDYLHAILHKITEGWRGRMPGYSIVYGGGIHLIDLIRWLVGDEIEQVNGMGTDLLARGSQFSGPDTTVNLLRFGNGVLAKTTTTFGPTRPQLHALNVYGTKATFVNGAPDAQWHTGDDPAASEIIDTPYPGTEKGDLLPDLIAAIREGREPKVSAIDVFRVADVCFAAAESIRTGATVKVSYLL